MLFSLVDTFRLKLVASWDMSAASVVVRCIIGIRHIQAVALPMGGGCQQRVRTLGIAKEIVMEESFSITSITYAIILCAHRQWCAWLSRCSILPFDIN